MRAAIVETGRFMRRALVRVAQATRLTTVVARSPWRRQRLLILCYHGISLADEHRWSPELFIPPALFRQRLELLAKHRYSVLPLREGAQALFNGDLPERAVSITFDDGFHDFSKLAVPMLRELGYPATVYLRTDYCGFEGPVFNIMVSYLLWKGGRPRDSLALPGGGEVALQGSSEDELAKARDAIVRRAEALGLSLRQKHEVLTQVAAWVGVDFDGILRTKLLQIMAPAEVAALAESNIDVGLHTHTHTSPRDEQRYRGEISANREAVGAITGTSASDFCYPSGEYTPEFVEWLHREKVETATTCVPRLADRNSDPLLLPRFIDTTVRTSAEFEAWLSGLGQWLGRTHRF